MMLLIVWKINILPVEWTFFPALVVFSDLIKCPTHNDDFDIFCRIFWWNKLLVSINEFWCKKKMKNFFLILLLVGKTSNILALPRYEKLDWILSPCSGAFIMYAQKGHLSTQIYKFFWVTALSILNALNSNFSGFHWKPKIKCSEDLYVNCGKTTK